MSGLAVFFLNTVHTEHGTAKPTASLHDDLRSLHYQRGWQSLEHSE